MKLRVLGARGSIPVSGPQFQIFGGATSCYLVEAGGETIFLDGGSGLVGAPEPKTENVHILLTHPHVDHLLGFPFYPGLFGRDTKISIYATKREGLDAQEFIDKLYAPPLWPVMLYGYPADISIIDMQQEFSIGSVKVSVTPSCHPGGSDIIRLDDGESSLVYATDFEATEGAGARLEEFARDVDLLLYDGQYTEGEYTVRRGFGHSTPERGVESMKKCGAKQLLIVHHDPRHTDDFLSKWEKELQERDPRVQFAREGMEIVTGTD